MLNAFPMPVLLRGAAVSLAAALLAAGCGDDDSDRAAAPSAPPPSTTTTAPAPGTTAPPAETTETTETAPAETQPAPETETQPPEEAEQPQGETGKADADAGTEASLEGAREAAAASLRAQLAGDYPTVKRLVTKRCGKQLTKASVEQMAAAFKSMSEKSGSAKLKEMLEKLSTPEGWSAKAQGGGVAKVTASSDIGISDYYFVREDGTWRDDTCAHQAGAATTQGA